MVDTVVVTTAFAVDEAEDGKPLVAQRLQLRDDTLVEKVRVVLMLVVEIRLDELEVREELPGELEGVVVGIIVDELEGTVDDGIVDDGIVVDGTVVNALDGVDIDEPEELRDGVGEAVELITADEVLDVVVNVAEELARLGLGTLEDIVDESNELEATVRMLDELITLGLIALETIVDEVEAMTDDVLLKLPVLATRTPT